MGSALVVPLLFFAAVLVVGAVKVRGAVHVFRGIASQPDRTLRRLLVSALLPALVASVWLSVRGLPPPISVAIGGLLMLGVFVASAGILGVEGGLVEHGSEAAARVARGRPPPSSPRGRVVALGLGLALASGASALGWWASQI